MKISQFLQKFCLSAVVVCAASAVSAAPSVIPAMPELAAKSYVLLDAVSGKVLVENNADERLPPASLTKLMTAYIATKEIKNDKLLSRIWSPSVKKLGVRAAHGCLLM